MTNAQQAVRSAQAQTAAQRQAVAAAADRTDAQQAVLAQTQQQLSYAGLRSPLTGFVLSRQVDLSSLKVNVEVSELDIGRLSDATATLNRSRDSLPDTVQQPRLFKFDPSQLPVYETALTSPSFSIGHSRAIWPKNRRGAL
ncbi:hypothetical protein BH23CYA1_BH23CYA1_17930 [soil metagenome]